MSLWQNEEQNPALHHPSRVPSSLGAFMIINSICITATPRDKDPIVLAAVSTYSPCPESLGRPTPLIPELLLSGSASWSGFQGYGVSSGQCEVTVSSFSGNQPIMELFCT